MNERRAGSPWRVELRCAIVCRRGDGDGVGIALGRRMRAIPRLLLGSLLLAACTTSAIDDEHQMSLFPTSSYRHRMAVLLKPIAYVVAHKFELQPNDGLVQVENAKWGHFRGCVPADHIDEVGAGPFRRSDHIRFLRNRGFELAAIGL